MKHALLLCVVLGLTLGTKACGAAAENMIGRQSHNEGLLVVPAPGPVTIDGDLGEWDYSGRIWCFAEKGIRNRYSAQVGCMWDADALYAGITWRDPSPMHNTVDPKFNPHFGWKGDSLQLRVHTGKQTYWFTLWYFAGDKVAVLHHARWKNPNHPKGGQEVTLLTSEPGRVDVGQGVEMGFKVAEDKQGYTEEVRIPWALLDLKSEEVKAGTAIQIGMEFLWGDPTGKTWPIHRYADNMASGVTSREFFWSNFKSWGEAKLVAAGQVEERKYVAEGERIQGSIPVRAEIPAAAARFTLALENAEGVRVRTLAADVDPADYAVSEKDGLRTVEVLWDGRKDIRDWGSRHDPGPKYETVEPGTYQVKGLWHKGLGAEYEMTFYNPGTPAWNTADTTGAWGADHSNPYRVARAGEQMIVCWPGAEGGHGIIAVGKEGRKVWGASRAAVQLAATVEYVYALQRSHRTRSESLIRLRVKDGSFAPFVLGGEERPFDLPVSAILGEEEAPAVTALAAQPTEIAMATKDGKLVLLEPESASPKVVVELENITALAYSQEGQLYALAGGALNQVLRETIELKPIATPGLGKATDLAADNDGNLLVADMGPDSQVKVYSPEGKLVYACGQQGGRPVRGPFEAGAMMHVSSVAVDTAGQVWTVENTHAPRRVSVWDRDGTLVRDYVGNAGYAGTASYLHDQDPALGYVGPTEMTLDKATRSWKVSSVLWEPTPGSGEGFALSVHSHQTPQRFRSAASGSPREYLFTRYRYSPQVLFMRRSDGWKPVAAVGQWQGFLKTAAKGDALKRLREAFPGLHPFDALFWNDTNKDGVVQPGECTAHKGKRSKVKRGRKEVLQVTPPFRMRGCVIQSSDLVFHTGGIFKITPIGFDDEGAPRYGTNGLKKLETYDMGQFVGVPEDQLLLCHSHVGYAGPTKLVGYDLATGEEKWYYPNPYPGVHGSHRAPMPKPGVLIGPLGILGVVKANDDAGNVFLMRGNLGQNFLFTTDGLFVGAMMQDGRLPYQSLPPKEEQLIGMPMESFSEGGEPFNGWFGRQDDGVVRLTTGMARQACMILQMKGLEDIHRVTAMPVTVDAAILAKAKTEADERDAKAAGPKTMVVKASRHPKKIDGVLNDWGGVAPVVLSRDGSPERANVFMAYDKTTLYLAFDVTDPTPWKNEGKDFTRLFKTGDAVDLQLCVDPALADTEKRGKLTKGDLRLVIAPFGARGREVAVVRMQPIAPDAPPEQAITYESPVGPKHFQRVERLTSAQVKVKLAGGNRYTLEAAIPLGGLAAIKRGVQLRGDVGFISSDPAGMFNTARTYWSNRQTNLVNDLPQEAWLYPNEWGTFSFE